MVNVTFARRNISPPADAYVPGGTGLTIATLNSHPTTLVAVFLRWLMADGSTKLSVYTHTPNRDRSRRSESIPINDGFLLSVVVVPTENDVRRGQLFCAVGLSSGAQGNDPPSELLVQGYVASSSALAWPEGVISDQASGHGALRIVGGTDPAAGVEISETVPTNARWRVDAVRLLLTTSAAVGNRTPLLVIDDGAGNVPFIAAPDYLQAAGQVIAYHFGAGGDHTGSLGAQVAVPLPVGLVLSQGWRVRTVTIGLDPGDDYTAPQMLVHEWIEE